jgi:hypothetical protein
MDTKKSKMEKNNELVKEEDTIMLVKGKDRKINAFHGLKKFGGTCTQLVSSVQARELTRSLSTQIKSQKQRKSLFPPPPSAHFGLFWQKKKHQVFSSRRQPAKHLTH